MAGLANASSAANAALSMALVNFDFMTMSPEKTVVETGTTCIGRTRVEKCFEARNLPHSNAAIRGLGRSGREAICRASPMCCQGTAVYCRWLPSQRQLQQNKTAAPGDAAAN